MLAPATAAIVQLQSVPTSAAVQIKAMAIRKYVDKMVMLAKEGSLHSRRQVDSPCWLDPYSCWQLTRLCSSKNQQPST